MGYDPTLAQATGGVDDTIDCIQQAVAEVRKDPSQAKVMHITPTEPKENNG